MAGCGDSEGQAGSTTEKKTAAPAAKTPTTESKAKVEAKAKARQVEAFDICKDFVKRRLKAPSTAKFRNPYQDDGEVVITGSDNGPFTVRSSVDSENAFGAKLRSNFTCVVTLNGDTWKLDNISIDAQ